MKPLSDKVSGEEGSQWRAYLVIDRTITRSTASGHAQPPTGWKRRQVKKSKSSSKSVPKQSDMMIEDKFNNKGATIGLYSH